MERGTAIPRTRERRGRALAAGLLAGGLAALLLTGEVRAEARVALVVGNSTYEQAPWLANPANDARLMAATLSRLGFAVTLETDVTQAGLRRALGAFTDAVAAAGSDSIAFFYYAGHGVQLDGRNYLVPVDAAVGNARDVVLGSVSASDLLQTLELAGGNANLVILDACRDNPFRRGTRGLSLGLARMDAPVGSIIGYATGPGQTALDGSGAHSPYTQALADALLTPGLAIEQVFKQVRRRVYEGTDGAQTPWEESSLIRDLALAGDAVQPAATASAQPAIAASRRDVVTDKAATDGTATVEAVAIQGPRDEQTPEVVDEVKEAAAVEPPRRSRHMPESTAAAPAPAAAIAGDPARVRDFILRYHAIWSGSGREAAPALAAFYGESVRYYGHLIARAEVLRDKSRFAARWPTRDYRVDGRSLRVSCGAETCAATYRVRFAARDQGANRAASGTAEARVVLAIRGADLAIIAEDSAVLTRE
jgi:uncharacterized caspase-like protein